MNRQRMLTVLAIVAGLTAGILYQTSVQRTSVLVAARDLDGLRAVTVTDVEIRSFPSDAVPAGALDNARDAVGRSLRAPLGVGHLVLAGSLTDESALFQSGLVTPSGMRAVGVPISSAANAVGGTLTPGSRVDVVAVPLQGRAPVGRTAELLAAGALVLDVRSDTGGPFKREPRGAPGAGAFSERLGSVVLAISPDQELLFADRIATSTFILVLAPQR